jgi:signal transduction histidine kinase
MTWIITSALLVVNLGFVVLLALFSRLVIGESDWISIGRGAGDNEVLVLGQDVLWKLSLPFIALSSVVFTAWIFFAMIRPLRLIVESLQAGSSEGLARISSLSTELGEIARQLEAAFRQKQALVDEILIRQGLEAQLRQSESRLQALSQERERFLHDLHDGLIQSLFSVGLKLDDKRLEYAGKDAEVSEFLAKSTEEINTLLSRLRDSLHRSVPFLRELYSLRTALQELVARFDGKNGASYSFYEEGDVDSMVSSSQAVEIQAICAESLMNAMRHSSAQRVGIKLGLQGSFLMLEISDNGRGFVPQDVEGMGLVSIRQRAARLQAQFDLETTPGKGTCLRLLIPIEKGKAGRTLS